MRENGWARRLSVLVAVGMGGALITTGVAVGAIGTRGRATPSALVRAVAPAATSTLPAAVRPAAAPTSPAAPAAPAAPAKGGEKHTLDTALGAVVIDGCSYGLLPLGLASVGLGLAGGGLPPEVANAYSQATQVFGVPLGTACSAFPLPETQSVCTADAVAVQMPGLVPPAQGRVVDLVDGLETTAADSGAPNNRVADQLRSQGGCKEVPF